MAARTGIMQTQRPKGKAKKEINFFVGESETIMNYEHGAAELPECCGNNDPATDYPEVEKDVKIWSPVTDDEEGLLPIHIGMAKLALAYAQVRQGVSDVEALENSCRGHGEQYISDVLHESAYVTDTALKTLMTKEVPSKVSAGWTPADKYLSSQPAIIPVSRKDVYMSAKRKRKSTKQSRVPAEEA